MYNNIYDNKKQINQKNCQEKENGINGIHVVFRLELALTILLCLSAC